MTRLSSIEKKLMEVAEVEKAKLFAKMAAKKKEISDAKVRLAELEREHAALADSDD